MNELEGTQSRYCNDSKSWQSEGRARRVGEMGGGYIPQSFARSFNADDAASSNGSLPVSSNVGAPPADRSETERLAKAPRLEALDFNTYMLLDKTRLVDMIVAKDEELARMKALFGSIQQITHAGLGSGGGV